MSRSVLGPPLWNPDPVFFAVEPTLAFFDATRDEILPEVKVSLTVQTVLSPYQMQGFVLYAIKPEQ